MTRKLRMRISFTFILVFFVSSLCFALTGSPEAGQTKVETCVACHSTDGNSIMPNWPKLAGQHQSYLVKQLKEFKMGESGPRYDPQMVGMVAALSEQDMADIAAFYNEQQQTKGKAKAEYVALGEKLYRGGDLSKGIPACSACHGPRGLGNALAKYPRLSGQHAEYTETQLKNFQSGARKNDPSGMMQSIAKLMTEDEMKAVSSYIEGLS